MRPPPTFRLSKVAADADAYSSSDGDGGSNEDDDDYRLPSTNANDNDDYSEFRPRKRRRGNDSARAKERATLGVFASDSDDDGQTARRLKKKTKLRARGVAFVSTGLKTSVEDDDEGEEEEEEDEEEEVEEDGKWPEEIMADDAKGEDEDAEMKDAEHTGIGGTFGFRGGLGFTKAMDSSDNGPTARPAAASTFTPFVPLSAALDSEEALPDDIKNEKPKIVVRPSAFGKGKGVKQSFAARMMAKMGYVEGAGLGAQNQGRNIIVEANLRPVGVGLGSVKEKSAKEREYEKKVARERGDVVVSSDDDHDRDKAKKQKARQKKTKAAVAAREQDGSGMSTPTKRQPRTRRRYMTAEELKQTAPGLHIPEIFAPILDLTAQESKLLTSTSGLMTAVDGFVKGSEQSLSAEEKKARKIVRDAQADLTRFTWEWKDLDDRKKWIDLELAERSKEVEELAAELEGLGLAYSAVAEELQSASNWDQAVLCLERTVEIQTTTREEIADMVVAALHPHLRRAEWDPLLEPTRFVDDLKKLAPVLLPTPSSSSPASADKSLRRPDPTAMFAHRVAEDLASHSRSHRLSTTAYETMIYTIWLPSVLAAIRTWDPSDTDAMLQLFEAWRDILPSFVHSQVIDAIARRLETAVSEWQPRKRATTPEKGKRANTITTSRSSLPHLWLFPWLRYLPGHHVEPRGTGLVAEVRRKFRHLIDGWDFSFGLIPGLDKWKPVFGPDHWHTLIVQSILPAMGRALRERFRVDPSDQEPTLNVLRGVLKWVTVLSAETVGTVLVQELFPAWHARLAEWIDMGPEANLEELAGWFGWWTDDVFPANVRELESITAEFDRANRKLWALISDEAVELAMQSSS